MIKEDPELERYLRILATDIEILVLGEVLKTIDKAYSKSDAVMLVAVRIQKARDELEALTLGEKMLAEATARYYSQNGTADYDT